MKDIETVKDNYADIVQKNLKILFSDLPADLANNMSGRQIDSTFEIRAFGRNCVISDSSIAISPLSALIHRGEPVNRPSASKLLDYEAELLRRNCDLDQHASLLAILISLYALQACPDKCIPEPFKGFKEFPGTMPYVGAFTTHTEQLLIPAVLKIKQHVNDIKRVLGGEESPAGTAGDFAFVVYPLPKIALCYIFYEADEDFGASVTCLFSNNADRFISTAGLADVGEYTSRSILTILEQEW